ncbi:MAG: LON peptidase substrate-binding domain-containing protein [Bacteroidota bacterium]
MPNFEDLPLFPLNVVLYPQEKLPLHIFEPRYRDMLRYCLESKEPFGVVYVRDNELATIGCTARVKQVTRQYDDGRLDILSIGETRFEIEEVLNEQTYTTARVQPLIEANEPATPRIRERAIAQHMRFLELIREKPRPELYERSPLTSYLIAPRAGLDLEQKQAVLEINTEDARLDYLSEHLASMIKALEQETVARRRVQSDGHFS